MPRRQLREGVGLPAEDFGDQFLVGFIAQTPPCPSASPATRHNCLLIRTDSPTVTSFRQISALGTLRPKMTKKEGGEIGSHHSIRGFNLADQTTQSPKGGSRSLYLNLMIGSESRLQLSPSRSL